MSQAYHQGIYSFSNEFERSQQEQQQQTQQQHIAQQIRRDKSRIQGFDPSPPPHLVGIEEKESGVVLPVYETVGMLSEMFSFPSGGVPTANELLESQISQSYRNPRPPPPTGAASPADWFLHRQGMAVGGGLGDSKNQMSSINADPAAAMQLFLMNSQQQRSPSPSSSHHHPPPTSSTLHMLLPNHSSSPNSSNLQTFHTATGAAFGQFTWVPNSEDETNPNEIPGVMEGQGLSLSLSSSLQHLEAVKAEELRMREGGMLCFGQGGGPSNSVAQYQFNNLNAGAATASSSLPLQGGVVGQNHQLQVGLGSSFGAVSILRNSKYVKAAQELLDEFCSVGRGQFKKNIHGQHNHNSNNADPSSNPSGGAGGVNSSSSSKDLPPLSAADRLEHQRRKVKLLSMLDEVDRRYSHYCEQMQMVVNSFDMVMGFGAAVPYTCLAQKAMSRHFRCLKVAIAAQLKHTCELLGEKDGGSSGITKGETPRLKILEQSLRQQRAFHHMGMMQQEAWRPQRGLPDRSVNILRAWLFEHFLHPYPSDADKHLLARQTGLSRNQVSNWFINARVRLWKPMVEEMYQQEAKDEADPQRDHSGSSSTSAAAAATGTNSNNAQTSTPHATTTTAITPPPAPKKSHEINAPESDPSFIPINRQRFSENQASNSNTNNNATTSAAQSFPGMQETDSGLTHKPSNAEVNESSTLIRFGANAGDVSLTLGLRHAGNFPEKSRFSIRDFGG